ncbi:Cytochrome c oxidase assembly protein cox18, mitochondrial, partial [Coemansia sp. RSA 2320]
MRESLKLELAANKSKVSDEQFQKMLVKRVSARHHRLMFEQGCHPVFNIMLPLTQIPIWVTMTSCLRHFSGRLVPLIDEPSGALPIPAPGMSSEGLLWFCDLAAVDSTGMLPAITGLVYLGNALAQRYRHNDY